MKCTPKVRHKLLGYTSYTIQAFFVAGYFSFSTVQNIFEKNRMSLSSETFVLTKRL